MTTIPMPRLSDSMDEGTVLRWLVEPGTAVERGQPLVEIETDKANVTYEAEAEGVLVELVAREGDTLAVGEPIARLAGDGDEAVEPTATGGDGAKGEVSAVEPSRVQRAVARRAAESRATVPDYALEVDVDMTLCVELRARLARQSDPPPETADMVVKAVALALRDHPRVNAAYRDGRFESYARVNVGITVPGAEAPVVPVVRDADAKSLGEIARVSRTLAERARSGEITAPELASATFTLADLGARGIDRSAAILPAPQAATLTVGALRRRPGIDEHDRVVARDGLTLTLTCDNRILFGDEAAAFLARVRELLEQPLALSL